MICGVHYILRLLTANRSSVSSGAMYNLGGLQLAVYDILVT